MSESITGSCLFGQVTYECVGEPEFTGNCHCRDCQKATGSAYTPELFFKETSVKVSGELKAFERQGDTGKSVWRHFCPHCGTRQPIASPQPRIIPRLVIMAEADVITTTAFPLEKDTNLIGRNDPHTGVFPEVDLTSFDPETKVSRRHARVTRPD